MAFQTIRVKEKTVSKTARNSTPAVVPTAHQHLVPRCSPDTIGVPQPAGIAQSFSLGFRGDTANQSFGVYATLVNTLYLDGQKKRRITPSLSAKKPRPEI